MVLLVLFESVPKFLFIRKKSLPALQPLRGVSSRNRFVAFSYTSLFSFRYVLDYLITMQYVCNYHLLHSILLLELKCNDFGLHLCELYLEQKAP